MKFKAEDYEFAKHLRSPEQFFQKMRNWYDLVHQNNGINNWDLESYKESQKNRLLSCPSDLPPAPDSG